MSNTVEQLEAGLRMLQEKYTPENMFTVADPDGDWPTPIGPDLDAVWAQLWYDIGTILLGFDVREWTEPWPLTSCYGAWGSVTA